MAFDFNGTTDRADWANPWAIPANNPAWSISFWAWLDVLPTTDYFWCAHQSGDAAVAKIVIADTSTNLQVYCEVRRRNFNITFATGQWDHYLITDSGGTSANNITAYLNGTALTPGTGTNDATTPAASGSWSAGGRIFDDLRNFDGRLANFGVWDRVLGAGEIAMLADGFSPMFCRRGLRWAPEIVRAQRDPISGQTGTLDGTAVIEHPRTIFPSGPINMGVPAAVPASLLYPAPFSPAFGALIGR